MTENFNLYSRYYDLLYQDKDYPAEAEYVSSIIEQYCHGANTLLELGSGTGKHAKLLAERGFNVTGIEASEEMVSIASKSKSANVEFLVANIIDFKLNKKFDAAISLFHVISYITQNDDLVKAFKKVYDHLNNNGIFFFDVWYTPAVYHQIPENRTKILSDEFIEVTRYATPTIHYNYNTVDVAYQISVKDLNNNNTTAFHELHPMRHFGTPEIELLAMHTGFKVIQAEEFLTGDQPSTSTWGVNYILKKQSNE